VCTPKPSARPASKGWTGSEINYGFEGPNGQKPKILSSSRGDYRRGFNWWLNLLTTYTLKIRDYTLQVTITYTSALSLLVSTSHFLVTDF
jgi:hypothetical protein